jgi:hypothetical protein
VRASRGSDEPPAEPKYRTRAKGCGIAFHFAKGCRYNAGVEDALATGASLDEIVGILIAVAPAIGLGRVVSAAPELALALGYDVDAALEART